MVVLEDADLDRAAAAANFGAFFHQGQICMSTERIVVDRAVADALAQKLAARASALPVGDPREQTTAIGPLINDAALRAGLRAGRGRRLEGRHGPLSGGEADGPCFPPTVLAGRHPGDADLRRGIVRAAGLGDRRRRSRRGGRGRQRHRVRPVGCGLQRERARRRSSWRSGSRAGSATSTTRPSTTSRRCRSAASRRAASGASAGAPRSRSSPSCAGSPSRTCHAQYPI